MACVQPSPEIDRVLRIPRREWTPPQRAELAASLTDALKTTGGTMSLRPVQAVALVEAAKWGGGLFPIRTGGGKTLLSLLLPRVIPSKRPLLLLPAHLIEKTEREQRTLRKHWNLPAFIRMESYQKVSRVSGAELLEEYAPDLIIADECHYLKNPSAAVTKRVGRYLKAHRDTTFVGMSGTLLNRSIRDVAHLASWALKRTNPFPEKYQVLDEWSRALDVNVAPHRRLAPGALKRLGTPLRAAYRERIMASPGIVATAEPPLDIPMTVRSFAVPLAPELEEAYRTLRKDWTTPDGYAVADGVSMWRHARELSNGFYSVWDPRPPDEWSEARSEWFSTARDIIGSNRRSLDTELQVRNAVKDGLYPEALPALRRWKAVEPSFVPNPVAVWVSDETIDLVKDLVRGRPPTLIWTDRPALGERLPWPYYGSKGIDAKTGIRIEDAPAGHAVLSIEANKEGRNLQHKWARNLILDVPPNGKRWEQLLARTHRPGQKAPVVEVDVLFGCVEDVQGFWRAVEDCSFAEEMTGQAQKLLHANLDFVLDMDTVRGYHGPQWRKTPPPETQEE